MHSCPNCGAAAFDGDEFCGNCGAKLPPAPPEQRPPEPSRQRPSVQPPSRTGDHHPPPASQPRGRPQRSPDGAGRRDLLKLGGAGALGVGVLGLGWLALEDDESMGVAGTDTPSPTAGPTTTETSTAAPPQETGPIPVGSILPITGPLTDIGEDMLAAVELAVEHVNDEGGPLDRRLELHDRDSETDAEAAVQQYEALIEQADVVGFVGAAASSVSTGLARRVGTDEVAQVSPSSTSPLLADHGWDGGTKYFARTAPNDTQQGSAMAFVCDEVVGTDRAAFLYTDTPYGQALAAAAVDHHRGTTVASVGYDPAADDYGSTLDALFSDDPEIVGLIGYPDSAMRILLQWDEGGYGGSWLFGEGVNTSRFLATMDEEVGIAGFHLVSPAPEATTGRERFEQAFPGDHLPFAPHAYDALFLQALAIHRAGEASGTAIARNLRAVSRPPGETITVDEFGRARDLLDDGDQIAYTGASGPLDLTEALEPIVRYAVYRIQDGGTPRTLERVPRSYFDGRL